MSNTPKLSRFVWGTLRFNSIRTLRLNSIRTESRLTNWLPAWRIDNRGNDSCRFDRIESNRQHFQPTLHSPPEVKIREIKIHEPSSFVKRGHKLQSIRTIPVESSRIDNIFNPPYIDILEITRGRNNSFLYSAKITACCYWKSRTGSYSTKPSGIFYFSCNIQIEKPCNNAI